MAQYAFYFDGTRCTECKTCMFACKDYKDTPTRINYRKVFEITGGTTSRDGRGVFSSTAVSYPVSSACQHCDTPACMAACATGALVKDAATGIVTVDESRCDACGDCTQACPYGAVMLDTERAVAVKCDGCQGRIAAGLKPVCVDACPCAALDFAPVDEVEPLGVRADMVPFPDPALTGPNLFIKPSEDAVPHGSAEMAITNALEL